MSEQPNKEKSSAQENLGGQKYKEWQAAMSEVDTIAKEINKILISAPDKTEEGRIIFKKYASLMDEAIKKSSEALKAWHNATKEI